MRTQLSRWEAEACRMVCLWYDNPIGSCPTALEIQEEVRESAPNVLKPPYNLQRLAEALACAFPRLSLLAGGVFAPPWRLEANQLLDRLVVLGYLTREPLKMIGDPFWRGAECYTPTDRARALLPEHYPPPIGTAIPWEEKRKWFDTWQQTGENGPCPLCGAAETQMHMGKYCFMVADGTGRSLHLTPAQIRWFREMNGEWWLKPQHILTSLIVTGLTAKYAVKQLLKPART